MTLTQPPVHAMLMEEMGYRFTDESYLLRALTHPSVFASQGAAKPDPPQDNQRLEFLGDAVVQLCVSDALYTRFPAMREGEMTRARISFVRKETLCEAARQLRLGDYLEIGPAERDQGVAEHTNVLCDAFEAVAAAVYLDGGFDAAKTFVARALCDYTLTSAALPPSNWKSQLQEKLQSLGQRTPTYHLTAVTGPSHAPWFTVEVRVQAGQPIGKGSGLSRKAAEQQAALDALRVMIPALGEDIASLNADASPLITNLAEDVIAT